MYEIGLKETLANIKGTIDCSLCPPKRNCCTFSRSFDYKLSKEEVEIIFGNNYQRLIEKGLLEVSPKGIYRFIGGRCPQLTKNNLCKIHSKKEELDVIGCIKFPIYLDNFKGKDDKGEEYSFLSVKVDYRCFEIEKNWEKFYDLLASIRRHYPIIVQYETDENNSKSRNFLDWFNEDRIKGKIPLQILR